MLASRALDRDVAPASPALRCANAAWAVLWHFGMLSLIGFVPWLIVAVIFGQIVVWLSEASHNQALVAGLCVSLWVTPILMRPVARFVRLNMTYWRPETIDSPGSVRFRYVTLLIGLGILPWLVFRFGLETIFGALTAFQPHTRFWMSAVFGVYFAWALMARVAPAAKRRLYPELLAPDLSRALAGTAEVTNGPPAVDGGLVHVADLFERPGDVRRAEIRRQHEGIDAHAGKKSDLVAQIVSADPELPLVPEPRAQ
jgi:hypothetical protein